MAQTYGDLDPNAMPDMYHEEVPSTLSTQVPLDIQGNKINPLGRGIDNALRSALGGEGVGGDPTPILGVLPQVPPDPVMMNMGSRAIQPNNWFPNIEDPQGDMDLVGEGDDLDPIDYQGVNRVLDDQSDIGDEGIIGADVFEDLSDMPDNPLRGGRFSPEAPSPRQRLTTKQRIGAELANSGNNRLSLLQQIINRLRSSPQRNRLSKKQLIGAGLGN